jgi:hypothetical protein
MTTSPSVACSRPVAARLTTPGWRNRKLRAAQPGRIGTTAMSPIWRSGCQGGRDRWPLFGWWCRVVVVAVRGAVRAIAGFATFGHAHIRGLGTPRPVFVARPLSKVERARRGGCSGDASRSCVREPGCSGRLASRNGLGRVQRELVSLLRVVGVGAASGPVMGQVAISQQ